MLPARAQAPNCDKGSSDKLFVYLRSKPTHISLINLNACVFFMIFDLIFWCATRTENIDGICRSFGEDFCHLGN